MTENNGQRSMKEKVADIFRFVNTAILGILSFLLIQFYNSTEKRNDKLDDVLIRMAVLDQVVKTNALNISTNALDIREIKQRLEDLRVKFNNQ